MNSWTIVLSFMSAILGATLQYWFTRSAEVRKQLDLLQFQSYVDYLRAVGKAAYANSRDALVSAQAEAADAKARSAVYGTPSVIAALAKFEETGPNLDNPRAHSVFVSLVAAMRQKNRAAQADDLKLVLFGREKDRG
jgi:hypothetical protein